MKEKRYHVQAFIGENEEVFLCTSKRNIASAFFSSLLLTTSLSYEEDFDVITFAIVEEECDEREHD